MWLSWYSCSLQIDAAEWKNKHIERIACVQCIYIRLKFASVCLISICMYINAFLECGYSVTRSAYYMLFIAPKRDWTSMQNMVNKRYIQWNCWGIKWTRMRFQQKCGNERCESGREANALKTPCNCLAVFKLDLSRRCCALLLTYLPTKVCRNVRRKQCYTTPQTLIYI